MVLSVQGLRGRLATQSRLHRQGRYRSTRCTDGAEYADFHANRHTFISNLAKSGVSPKVAQTMARHCDINLTMNVSYVQIDEQTAAISVLPSPPKPDATGNRKTRKNGA